VPLAGPAILRKAKPGKRNRAAAERRPNVGQKPAIVTPDKQEAEAGARRAGGGR
jgi:hypothetical protein